MNGLAASMTFRPIPTICRFLRVTQVGYPLFASMTFGNGLAHVFFTFGAMNPHDPIIIAPPITEVPDYVWSPV